MLYKLEGTDNFISEVQPSRALELTDVEMQPLPRAFLHPMARRLGELLTDPRVSGDFFQTVYSVQAAVNQNQPSKQTVDDARFLLAWFWQSTSSSPIEAAESPKQAPPERPVLDAAAQEAARVRSIAAALSPQSQLIK